MNTPVYITSAAAWIPPAESAKEAVADGRYTAEDFTVNNILCLPVATGETPVPDMAVIAGRRALERAAATTGDRVDLLVHASLYHQGRDWGWTSAPYIQRELGLHGAFSVNVEGLSNGGMAAIDLAAAQLQAGRATTALITTADRFCAPGVNRWRGAYGIVGGDGATAMVLSTTGGFARIHAVQSLTDASLEPLWRGAHPFTTFYGEALNDLRTPKKSYLEEVGKESVLQRCEEALLTLVRSVLDTTGHKLDDFARILMPNMGHGLMQVQFLQPLGITPERSLMDWGRHTGHLGAGDLIAGTARLAETRQLHQGDHVLLVSAGGGYSLTVAAIEIESVPNWTDTTTDFALPADVTP
ncbi:ketoacyl-ACP synthase III family protein [Kitasatospora sp. RG8]|uniref:ketoacyl-ACP synthase III family protein n=1 Tax=Kitasatospora sp. RG8 TaxID=2820815 RepID=UPI001ADF842F|nr:ketoacyl-ACP synthase III family protein [Kitasatospora sp. RG8]MBP0455827.1 ketoacyl-ACP synthase III family protein [Kitasatospora sp. RG8]